MLLALFLFLEKPSRALWHLCSVGYIYSLALCYAIMPLALSNPQAFTKWSWAVWKAGYLLLFLLEIITILTVSWMTSSANPFVSLGQEDNLLFKSSNNIFWKMSKKVLNYRYGSALCHIKPVMKEMNPNILSNICANRKYFFSYTENFIDVYNMSWSILFPFPSTQVHSLSLPITAYLF